MADILARFGPHPLAESRRIAARPDTAAKAQALHRDLVAGATAKADLSASVLDRGPFDLFLTVFAEPHWAMHLFWDNLDPTHPQHDPVRARQHASLFAEILGQIDRFIGAARARRPDADLVVFSLSGMGPNYSGWHLLPEVLARLGLGAAPAGPRKGRRQLPDLVRRMEALAPQDLLDRIKLLFPTRTWDRLARHVAFGRSGWSRCRAFCLPNDYSGAIRINLAGREPQGRVAPGADYDAVCREITDALLALLDLETGRPAVREVVRSRVVFPGERADDLPDLIVRWPGDNPLQVVGSATLGEIRLPSPERRCGAHRPTGFLLAAGPGVTPGSRSGRVEIVDLAPTILHLLGLPVPAGLDGRILHELLVPEQSVEAQEVAVRARGRPGRAPPSARPSGPAGTGPARPCGRDLPAGGTRRGRRALGAGPPPAPGASPGGTSSPFSSSLTTSTTPAIAVATTGARAAIASRRTTPWPSWLRGQDQRVDRRIGSRSRSARSR